MTDEKETLPITDPHDVSVVFVNQLAGVGILNGVVNLSFAVANFMPRQGGNVDPDLVIATRLRMDMWCARQLYEQLGKLLEQNLPPANTTSH